MTTQRRASTLLLAAGLALGLTACGAVPADPAGTVTPTREVSGTAAVGGAANPGVPAALTPAGDVPGALRALTRYLDAERQAYLTGDTAAAAELAPEHCTDCWTRLDLATTAHTAGFELTGGETTVELQRRLTPDEVLGEGTYDSADVVGVHYLDVTVRAAALTLSDGTTTTEQPATSYTLQTTVVALPGGRWEVWQMMEAP